MVMMASQTPIHACRRLRERRGSRRGGHEPSDFTMTSSATEQPALAKPGPTALAVTGLAALGIVFGDIGTSPLYTLKTAFDFLGGDVTPDRILGMLSLFLWSPFFL